mmetsp:Transcript_11379/g.11083  ORF Transcript_11379/g.11083 Transcript_11379/m.11083 type:complete len:98 (+) Transcript_11379:79-372(+)
MPVAERRRSPCMTPVFGVVRTGTSVQHEESNDDEIRTGVMMAVRAPSHQSKFPERVCSTLLSLSLSLFSLDWEGRISLSLSFLWRRRRRKKIATEGW